MLESGDIVLSGLEGLPQLGQGDRRVLGEQDHVLLLMAVSDQRDQIVRLGVLRRLRLHDHPLAVETSLALILLENHVSEG